MKGANMTEVPRRLLLGTALASAVPRIGLAQNGDIDLFVLAPLTGTLAFTGLSEQQGWQDAIEWINANGGANGRRLRLNIADSEYKVDVGTAAWKRALGGGNVAMVEVDQTPMARAIGPENNDRYKVFTTASANASDLVDATKYKYFFLPALTYSDMMDLLLQQVSTMAGAAAKPRIALVHSNTEFGRDPIAHARALAESMGAVVTLVDETAFTGVDVTASAIKLRNARPDFVIFHGYAGNVWPEIVRLARDYNVKAQFMATIFAVDPEIIRGIGEAADGIIGVVPHALRARGNDAPAMKAVDAALTKRNPNYSGYAGIGYIGSWAVGLFTREVIANALKAGKEINGDTLIAEAEKLKDWDSGGVFGGLVTPRDHRIPAGSLYRYNVSNNKVELTVIAEGLVVKAS